MQIVNNQTISVVMDDNTSVFFVKNGVAKESIIPNLRTLYKNQLWPELTCRLLKRHQIFIQVKIDQLTSTVSNLSSSVSKLANNAHAATQVTTSSPNVPPRAPTTSNTNVIGMPAVSNLENCKVNQGLQQRNILWTRVNDGGIDLPLPNDSCCSVSLVSGAHTDNLLKTNSQLKYTPLADPIPVAVANPTTQLKAIGTMEVPITFANGHTTTFLMLLVPGLAWPILYRETIFKLPMHSLTIKL